MFTISEFQEVLDNKTFIADYNWVQQNLVNKRIDQAILFNQEINYRLDYFVESVFASCTEWEGETNITRIAAEIAEHLSLSGEYADQTKRRNRVRSAILYEHAGMPALSSSVIQEGDVHPLLFKFFRRRDEFQKLLGEQSELSFDVNGTGDDILTLVFIQDVINLINYQQGLSDAENKHFTDLIAEFARHVSLDLNSSEIAAFSNVIKKRLSKSTKRRVDSELFQKLKQIMFPIELWPAQTEALNNGLLDRNIDSWGLAAPTGTGKTFLTRLLIIDNLTHDSDGKILYIVPSRALVYEVHHSLSNALENLRITVMAVNPQLSDLDEEEENRFENASVVVLTPEKADLLARLNKGTLDEISLVIIDEAHHIESDTRGVLLELYLWRLKRLITREFRFIFLSAVTPNINELTQWGGQNAKSKIVEDRATRMRAGVFRVKKENRKKEGWINYADGTKTFLLNDKIQDSSNRKLLVQVAEALQKRGAVLIVAKGKKECEHLATELLERQKTVSTLKALTNEELTSEKVMRLDSRLEREMYSDVPLRDLIKNRIAYHHAGLPPRVRFALEDLIREGNIDYVFATTTLAEGVNFPFSTVLVQSLAFREPPQFGVKEARYKPITPRSFWNIAGRAGRPGLDSEGQVILFEPSLGLDKINSVLSSYLNPNLKDIEPLKSGLFKSIQSLYEGSNKNEFSMAELDGIELPESVPKTVRGTINLLRVGLVHAKANNILDSPEDIIDSTFAASFFSEEVLQFGKALVKGQSQVVTNFFNSPRAPSERIVSEIGLSLDTMERLKNYVLQLEDWQLNAFNSLFFGGTLNLGNAGYIIGPVAKNIAELEGTKLGGILSDLAVNWLSGVPLTVVKTRTKSHAEDTLEDLISVLYSRVQYLLPWGLFAVDTIIEEEAKIRKINYNNAVKKLSYLTDVGVPSFDAYRLVNLDFERVDATRLSTGYKNAGGQSLGVDIVGWIKALPRTEIEQIVKGIDNRRIDYDLNNILTEIKQI